MFEKHNAKQAFANLPKLGCKIEGLFRILTSGLQAKKQTNMDYFDKPELTKAEQKYYNKIQGEIESCVYCQPFDEGEAVWIHGQRTELNDLFYQFKVPEKYFEKIVANIYCPFCSNDTFEIYSDVGVKTKFDKEVEKHMDEVNAFYGSEVKAFEDLLEKYPLLAYSHKLGRKIFKEIKNKSLPVIAIEGNFFRSRKVETSEVYNKDSMYNPPKGKPTEGRFNHAGQSHLYLSNSKETAILEVIKDEKSLLVWCQEFSINKKIENILDLSFDWDYLTPSTSTLLLSLKIYNTIGRTDRNTGLWRPDYYLTRFIMDCAKASGYNGIKYNSTKDTFEFDLVLFDPDSIDITPVCNPSVEIFSTKDELDNLQSKILDI